MLCGRFLDKKIKGYDLYKRNIYKFLDNYRYYYMEEKTRKILTYIQTEMDSVLNKVYLNYLEIPITTQCTLRCKECSNLIQYYEKPYQIKYTDIVKDIKRLCRLTEGIGTLRILGGEPLLHKDLYKIIYYLSRESKIENIQIVTNGTLIPSYKVLKAMRNNKVSVDISNYKNNSYNIDSLIKVLEKNCIKYFVAHELYWTCQSDFRYRNRSKDQLEKVKHSCYLDCISMLNGELHLCPRSSHGNDLSIFKVDEQEFFNVRKKGRVIDRRKELIRILKQKLITACNYCDVFKWEELEQCTPGEQITRKAALEIFYCRINK